MKKLFKSNGEKAEVYLIPFSCECGCVFSVDKEDEFSYNADTGMDVVWVEAKCPDCDSPNLHEFPLTKQEVALYAFVQYCHMK